MKTTSSNGRALAAASVAVFALGLIGGAQAQPTPDKPATAEKPAKPRAKTMTPRMVKATEAATGKPLAPALKKQISTAMQARQDAIDAANAKFYADFAAFTGLTLDQVREIDKPTRAKPPTAPGADTKTNLDNLTTGQANPAPAVSPQNP